MPSNANMITIQHVKSNIVKQPAVFRVMSSLSLKEFIVVHCITGGGSSVTKLLVKMNLVQ